MHIESFLRQLFETDRPRFEVSRNQILTSIGDIEDRIFYIHEGAVCAFYLHNGQEQVIRMGYKGSVINALPSFYERTPSQLEIRAIRDSVCSSIDREAFMSIALDEAHIHSYMELLQQLICQQMERELDILSSSPQERIERLLQRSPQVFQEIPRKYIASYLRMTPETLSRLLSKS